MRELPVLDETKCPGCVDCVAVCPVRGPGMARPVPWVVRPKDCMSRAACVAVCPTDAIALCPLPAA